MKRTRTITRSGIDGIGCNAKDAKKNLDEQIDQLCRTAGQCHVEMRLSCLIVIAPSQYGWKTQVRPPEALRKAPNGHVFQFSCLRGPAALETVIDDCRIHAAQIAWTPNSDDAVIVDGSGLSPAKVSELKRWIRFQRSYIALAHVIDPNARHRQACDLASQYMQGETP